LPTTESELEGEKSLFWQFRVQNITIYVKCYKAYKYKIMNRRSQYLMAIYFFKLAIPIKSPTPLLTACW